MYKNVKKQGFVASKPYSNGCKMKSFETHKMVKTSFLTRFFAMFA